MLTFHSNLTVLLKTITPEFSWSATCNDRKYLIKFVDLKSLQASTMYVISIEELCQKLIILLTYQRTDE